MSKYFTKKTTLLYDSIVEFCKGAYYSPDAIFNEMLKIYPDITKVSVYNAIKILKRKSVLYQKGNRKGCKVSSYQENKVTF